MKGENMKKLLVAAVLAVSAGVIIADEAKTSQSERGHRPRQQRRSMEGRQVLGQAAHNGSMILMALSNPELVDELKLDEETLAKLKEKSKELLEKRFKIEEKIRELSLKQVKLMKQLVDGELQDTKELNEQIDEIALLRADQGRLAIESIVWARQHFSKEQIDAATEFMKKKGGAMFRNRNGDRGGRFGRMRNRDEGRPSAEAGVRRRNQDEGRPSAEASVRRRNRKDAE
jgi:hypothetical protein